MDTLEVLHSTLRMTTPIALAALGGLFTHRAGVLNIALEGMMLIGAFVAVIVSTTGNLFLAIVTALVATALMSLIFSVFSITLKSNYIITGLAVNIFALGITSFTLQSAFGTSGVFSSPDIIKINPINIPFLDSIPIVGKVLNGHTPIVYFSLFALVAVVVVLYKTKFGLYTRVVGENEEAAKAAGININRIKYLSVLISGLLSALAGISLALENAGMFVENMTNGRGFIALAAIFCGRGTPVGTFVFSSLFGFADAVQLRLQSFNIPGSFIQMIPFIFIIVILTIIGFISIKGNTLRRMKHE